MFGHKGTILLAALLATGLIAAPDAHAFGSSKMKAESDLVRPSGSSAPTAKGNLKVQTDTKKGEDRFEVHAIQIDPAAVHELWMEDPLLPGSFVMIAVMDQESGDGSAQFRADTKKGDALPHDADSVVDLAGLGVEVRPSGMSAVLEGAVPVLGADKKPVKAKLKLAPPAVPPAPDAKGDVKLRSKFDKGDHSIELKAKKLPYDVEASFHVFLETEVEGVFQEVATLEQKGKDGGHWRVRTKDGEPLPLGVAGVDELEGRDIQVRGADLTTVYLEGVIPAMS